MEICVAHWDLGICININLYILVTFDIFLSIGYMIEEGHKDCKSQRGHGVNCDIVSPGNIRI